MAMKKSYYTVNGQIIAEKTAGQPRVDYLTDALGSVTATVNQSAQVVNTYRYKPYGALLAKTGSGVDPAFGWVGSQGYRPTGRVYSDIYVRARHYMTITGRWLILDTLYRDGINLYQYGMNNPITASDPSGESCPTCPKSCQGPNNYNQDPPSLLIPKCPKPSEYGSIIAVCAFNTQMFKSGGGEGVPPKYDIAHTSCCKDPISTQIVGCTTYDPKKMNNSNSLPSVFQQCLVAHEIRRRECCRATGQAGFNPSEGVNGKVDAYLWIDCGWENLAKCFPKMSQGWLNKTFPGCKPPVGYKLPNNGAICGSQ